MSVCLLAPGVTPAETAGVPFGVTSRAWNRFFETEAKVVVVVRESRAIMKAKLREGMVQNYGMEIWRWEEFRVQRWAHFIYKGACCQLRDA